MMRTEFYKLAEKIANQELIVLRETTYNPQFMDCFVCNILGDITGAGKFFKKLYMPSIWDDGMAWMCSTDDVQLNNNHRIIALLFADLMWKELQR